MRVIHLNCCSLYPPLNMLAAGVGSFLRNEPVVTHCLLVDTGATVVLVDSGIGLRAIADPRTRLGPGFVRFSRPKLDPAETAIRQLERHGYAATDVEHIVLTHLDADHAGGISDFPHARIHVRETELRNAETAVTRLDRVRYRAGLWAHKPDWAVYEPGGESWFGFDAVRQLHGLPEELLIVPLPGHSPGHVGVAVDTGKGWLLHAGDAHNVHREIDPRSAPRNPFLLLTQLMQGKTYRRNQHRLRELLAAESGDITVFSAHDNVAFQRFVSG